MSSSRSGPRSLPLPSAFPDDSLDELLEVARTLLVRARHGALATVLPNGMPFGSIQAFATDGGHCPLFALRAGSEHAKNLRRDQRASLLVAHPDFAAAPLTGPRVTYVGRAYGLAVHGATSLGEARLEADAAHATRTSLAAHPNAVVYRLEVERLRVVTSTRTEWIVLH